MSGDLSAGQIVGGIIGAVIGFYAGGPAGALYGASLGFGIGTAVDPPPGPSLKAPRLQDLTNQISSYGAPIPRVYGTYQTYGNVFWIQDNKLIEVAEKKKQGGKGGGGGATITTYKYFGTFAVSLCEGPIIAVKRIWIAGDLWYNAGSDDLGTIIQSNRSNLTGLYGEGKLSSFFTTGYAASWQLYRGTDSQSPDPLIEADIGAGITPAYRGTAYIVFNRLPLEKYGNSIMGTQVKVEVVTADNDYEPAIVETYTQDVSNSEVVAINGYADKVALTLGNSTWGNQDNDGLTKLLSLLPGTDGIIDKLANINTSGGALPLETCQSIGDTTGAIWVGGNGGTWIYANGRYYNFFIFGYENSQVRFRGGYLYAMRGSRIFKLASTAYDGDSSSNRNNGLIDTTIQIADSAENTYTFDVLDGYAIAYRQTDLWVFNIDDFSDYSIISADSNGFPLNEDDAWLIAGDGRLWLYNIDLTDTLYLFNESLTGIERTYTLPANTDLINPTAFIDNGIMVRGGYNNLTGRAQVEYIALTRVVDSTYPLATVLRQEMTLSNLIETSDIDTSLVDESVRGLRIPGVSSVRNNIAPLQIAYPFDIVPSGYSLKIVPRNIGTDSNTITVPEVDLNARDFDSDPGIDIERARTEDSQLPRKVIIKYSDADRDGDISEQYSPERLSTESVNLREIELALSLTANEAAGVAQNIWNAAWIERNKFTFTLPPTYQALEPADVIFIELSYSTFQMRITSINYRLNGVLECQAVEDEPAQWVPNAYGSTGDATTEQTIPIPGDAAMVMMDLPLMREADDSPGFAVAMYGEYQGWPGGVLVRSSDNEQTWDQLQYWTDSAVVGVADDALGADPGYLIDRVSTLTVRMESGELDSITEAVMLGGQQHWVAYGSEGRWEILLFANADIQSDGSYLISTFLRGQKGTEWATELHEDDDYFVLLDDPDVLGITTSIGELSAEYPYRAVTLNDYIEEAETEDFTWRGINLKPLDGVDIRFEKSGNDWTWDFTPRTRYSSAWWSTGVEPEDETTVLYEADIVGARTFNDVSGGSPFVYDIPDGFTGSIDGDTYFDPARTNAGLILDSGEGTVTNDNASAIFESSMVTPVINTTDGGKFYLEFTIDAITSGNIFIGIAASGFSTAQYIGQNATSWGYYGQAGTIWTSAANSGNPSPPVTYTANDIIMMAIDMDNGQVWWGKNGTWLAGGDPSTLTSPTLTGLSGSYEVGVTLWGVNDAVTAQFQQPDGIIGEEFTGYVRTLQSTTPDFTYTSAQQVEDYGLNVGAVDVEVYKVSSRVGRGYRLQGSSEATLDSND